MPPVLKHREQQILSLIADGLTAPEIARRLSLSAETVRWYIKQLYRELGVSSRAEAIRVAMTRGLLDSAVATVSAVPIARSDVRYANNHGVHIAYQIVGDGPIDVLFIHGFLSHLDLAWEYPEYAAFFSQLGRVARVILFDKRGVGLSDRDVGPSTLEQSVDDARCVLDAVGSSRAFVMGTSEGGAAAILLASMRPDRVDGLVLINASPFIGGHGTDLPWETDNDSRVARLHNMPSQWGEAWSLERFAPSRAASLPFREWWTKVLRAAASPSAISTVLTNARATDIRRLLPAVNTRTLVVHRVGDRMVPRSAGRYLANTLPHARLLELPGDDHMFFVDGEELSRALVEYLQQPDASADVRSWIAIILCMAGSHATLDDAKREVLESNGARFVRQSDRAWTACFDAPSAAIRCARQLRALGSGRVGGMSLHVGACSVSDGTPIGDTQTRCLDTASRASSGEVLVTGTLRDILAGSDVALAAHSVTPDSHNSPAATTWVLTV